jgi:predicted nucleic acid-binding Zn ribbon protein
MRFQKRRGPEKIGDIVAQLMARRGFARVQSAAAFQEAWRQAAGEVIAGFTRVGPCRRGKLEIIVANSTLVQELQFQKQSLVAALARLAPDENIKDLRFRVGEVSK